MARAFCSFYELVEDKNMIRKQAKMTEKIILQIIIIIDYNDLNTIYKIE